MISEFLKSAIENPTSSHIYFFNNHRDRRDAFGECLDELRAAEHVVQAIYMDYSIRFPAGGKIIFAHLGYRNELMKFAGIRPRAVNVDHCDPEKASYITEFFTTRLERRSK